MSIQSEISRITDMRDLSFTELASKGVNVPSGVTIDDLPEYIAALPETIKGHGVPTTSTEGLVGQHYFNLSATEPPYEYVCSDISGGAYTWIPAGYGERGAIGPQGPQGDSGVYVGPTAPTDDDIRVWLDTSGTGTNGVSSVNGKQGHVQLNAADVGAKPASYVPTFEEVDQTPRIFTAKNGDFIVNTSIVKTADDIRAEVKNGFIVLIVRFAIQGTMAAYTKYKVCDIPTNLLSVFGVSSAITFGYANTVVCELTWETDNETPGIYVAPKAATASGAYFNGSCMTFPIGEIS